MPDGNKSETSIRLWFRLVRLEARMQAAVGDRLRQIGAICSSEILMPLG